MQSITKTNIHLIFGRLLAAGQIDLAKTIGHYLPGVGTGANSPLTPLPRLRVATTTAQGGMPLWFHGTTGGGPLTSGPP